MASLEATPALFASVMALADFLSLETLVAQLVAKERSVTLAGRGVTSPLADACAAAVPSWTGLLAGYRGKLVTAAVSHANFNQGGVIWENGLESFPPGVDWKEELEKTEEGQLLHQYIKRAYPKVSRPDDGMILNWGRPPLTAL